MKVKTETSRHMETYAGCWVLQAGMMYAGINVCLFLLTVPFYARACATHMHNPVCTTNSNYSVCLFTCTYSITPIFKLPGGQAFTPINLEILTGGCATIKQKNYYCGYKDTSPKKNTQLMRIIFNMFHMYILIFLS